MLTDGELVAEPVRASDHHEAEDQANGEAAGAAEHAARDDDKATHGSERVKVFAVLIMIPR